MVKTKCALSDCLHWHPDGIGAPHCLCSHPEKKFYMDDPRCPLYRLDWGKQCARAVDLQERLRHRNA